MKKFLNKIFILTTLFLITGCNFSNKKEKITVSDCDTLSLNCYVGKPNDCYELKVSCSNINYQYTKEICQQAFNQLLIGSSQSTLETQFGFRVTECFSQEQKNKYLK